MPNDVGVDPDAPYRVVRLVSALEAIAGPCLPPRSLAGALEKYRLRIVESLESYAEIGR